MRTRRALVSGGAVAVLLLVGCTTQAPIHNTVGQGSKLCTDLSSLTTQLLAINDAANLPPAQLQQDLQPIETAIAQAQADAPTGDTVGGHSVKTDLTTLLTAYRALLTNLQNANASNPAAVANAISPVQAQYGEAVTGAAGRLDDYANRICKIPTPGSTTSTSSTTTTVGPSGPVGPTTSR